jgi:hypothetical protein
VGDSTDSKPAVRSKRGAQDLDERKSDATSDETLSDIEETEKDSASATTRQDPGPSPDGAFDEKKETDDAGPM